MRGWGLPLRSCVLLLFSRPLYSYHTAACCPHKRKLCSCFTCADYSLCLEYSSLRYAHGFLLHFLQVFYSERLAQVPPKKTQHPVPLLSFLIFLQSTRHRWTFYTCSFVHCTLLGKVSSHLQGLCLLSSCPGTSDSARLRGGADVIC